MVIGLFRSQEEAPSSEEETHVLSRYLLFMGTRLRRDGTRSVYVYKKVSKSGLKAHHFLYGVFGPYMLAALELDTLFSTDSILFFPHGLLS